MRKPFDPQQRLDCQPVLNVPLNRDCRDEIVPILRALQHIYTRPHLRDDILPAIARDVNRTSSRKRGRCGLDYWQILVLAAVRLGCQGQRTLIVFSSKDFGQEGVVPGTMSSLHSNAFLAGMLFQK
jgi:hypothetical protein